uniref:GLOBIN domain-containing protein n=1 Tax=Syphacia muris TaxID=451379 RepID=A0A0N5AD79_9BILA
MRNYFSSSSSALTKASSISSGGSCRTQNPSLSQQSREIIQFCFDNPHSDIGARICTRTADKRVDFQRFIATLGKDKWHWFTNTLRQFLEDVVQNVENIEKIEELSRKYGERYVSLRPYSFKPDLWVSLADAIITECIILDMATHQPTDTVAAWSQLVSLMFSSVRDGYYAKLRHQRKVTRKTLSEQSDSDAVETQPKSVYGNVRSRKIRT